MDDRQFRNAMGKFATGVTVIATETDGQVHGMTANAFMSVSLDPKLIVISVKEDAKMLHKIKESNHFSVNVLSCEQQEESMIFAGQKQPEEEFQFDYLEGVPVVRNALVQLSCEIYNEHVEGDHTLFVGRVTEMELKDGDPLIFNCGKYRELKEMESVSN
ncbi:flavin reductase family protein [Thalassobacillus sp. B23F22_16]|uniref:flavin reductase family protein n=1 Tax=Thalassobacillus sp. B23F22_16 TaxID=3459513 RepID=UPI00373F4569